METLPRISVITSSYNQGAFIERTIESVLAQGYPNLEHIVVDGMSSDETPQVLARYPHLRVIREPDKGQADAINKGFRAATGEILCFLNSDDTFLPGALLRVAQEIDPARGRHIVIGRCRFIDEHDTFLGIEHPSAFESHRRVLEIWKGYSIPQPAVFWTREVWERCGSLNEQEQLMLDYELFCRYSKHYHFHFIDQVLATYRLHTQSKTSSVSDEQRLEDAIQVSRRFWGSPASAQFWQILVSYGLFRLDRRRRAVGLFRRGRDSWRQARRPQALLYALTGGLIAPDIVADVLVLPLLKSRLLKLLQRRGRLQRLIEPYRRLKQKFKPHVPHPQTLAWRDFTSVHADSWVGPVLITEIDVAPDQIQLVLAGNTAGFRLPRPLELQIYIDQTLVNHSRVGNQPVFTLEVPLGNLTPGRHELKIVANTSIVPYEFLGVQDFRPLVFKLSELSLTAGR
jgi:glycosyltransferase involved in cell wall biosynthesis